MVICGSTILNCWHEVMYEKGWGGAGSFSLIPACWFRQVRCVSRDIMAKINYFNRKWWCCLIRSSVDQYPKLDFYNSCSLNQQLADRHVDPLGHISYPDTEPIILRSYSVILTMYREATKKPLVWQDRGLQRHDLYRNSSVY